MGHPLGMAPCAEAPHPVGFIRSVGFYPSLASTFPAHYCPLHGLVSLLRAITLTEHYMAAWGYEFYLRVLKVSLTRSLRSLVRDTFSTRRQNSYPPRGHVISSIYQNKIVNSAFRAL